MKKRDDTEVIRMVRFAMDEKDIGRINTGQFMAFIAGLLSETEPLEPEGWEELLEEARKRYGDPCRYGSTN